MKRRSVIAALPFLGAASVLRAKAAPPKFDLQDWLDSASTMDVVQWHTTQATIALHKLHGGAWKGTIIQHVQHPQTVLIVCQDITGDCVWIQPSGGQS